MGDGPLVRHVRWTKTRTYGALLPTRHTVLAKYVSFCNRMDCIGFPSVDTLVRETRLKRHTVCEALGEFEGVGILKRVGRLPRQGKRGPGVVKREIRPAPTPGGEVDAVCLRQLEQYRASRRARRLERENCVPLDGTQLVPVLPRDTRGRFLPREAAAANCVPLDGTYPLRAAGRHAELPYLPREIQKGVSGDGEGGADAPLTPEDPLRSSVDREGRLRGRNRGEAPLHGAAPGRDEVAAHLAMTYPPEVLERAFQLAVMREAGPVVPGAPGGEVEPVAPAFPRPVAPTGAEGGSGPPGSPVAGAQRFTARRARPRHALDEAILDAVDAGTMSARDAERVTGVSRMTWLRRVAERQAARAAGSLA